MAEDSTGPLSARQVWLVFGVALGIAALLALVSGDGAPLPPWIPTAWLIAALLAVYAVQTDAVQWLATVALLAVLWVTGAAGTDGPLPDWALPVAVVLAGVAVVALAAARGELRADREYPLGTGLSREATNPSEVESGGDREGENRESADDP